MLRLSQGLLLAAALLVQGALTACGSLPSSAADCWGSGAMEGSACSESKSPELAALVLGESIVPAALFASAGASCGVVVDCGDLASSSAVAASAPEPAVTPSRQPSPEPAAAPTERATGIPEPAASAVKAPSTAVADSTSTGATGSSDLEASGAVVPPVPPVPDAAPTAVPPSSARTQEDVIALYNSRAAGWQEAVDSALKQNSMKNSPLLNFAGLKSAYDRGAYSTVLKRARVVKRNLGKGYQIDRGFLFSTACRAANQLNLKGSAPSDGLDWCEGWLDFAESAGKSGDAAKAQDIIDQLE